MTKPQKTLEYVLSSPHTEKRTSIEDPYTGKEMETLPIHIDVLEGIPTYVQLLIEHYIKKEQENESEI